MEKIRNLIHAVTSKLDWLPGLISRITIGTIFIESGYGKLTHLDRVIHYFATLGIPAPQLQAPFVACVELGCGTLVLIGLATRIAAIPLIGTMVVAIMTAKRSEIHEFGDLVGQMEFLLIVLFIWLIVKGAGALSIDRLISGSNKE
jgi:putative oxidoreductase